MHYNGHIPKPIELLMVLGGNMQAGLEALAAILGITQLTAAELGAATDAVVQKDKDFNEPRSALDGASKTIGRADSDLNEMVGKRARRFHHLFW